MDAFKNFAKSDVSTGYAAGATSIVLASGGGAKFPTPPFNAVWWDAAYPDPSSDPDVEVVRVTNVATDTLTITRAQEGTADANHNTGGRTYCLIAPLTALTLNAFAAVATSGSASDLGTGTLPIARVADGAVTLAKMADLAQDKVIMRTTASTGVPETATITAAARTVLDDATVAAMLTTLGGIGPATTDTLTNKRITRRTGTTTSSATPTINTDNVDRYVLSAQAANITSFTTNLSGTPVDGDTLWIVIVASGGPWTIAWGTSFESSTATLPTTVPSGGRIDVGLVYSTATSKFRCVAYA